jgi:hypothetical protein
MYTSLRSKFLRFRPRVYYGAYLAAYSTTGLDIHTAMSHLQIYLAQEMLSSYMAGEDGNNIMTPVQDDYPPGLQRVTGESLRISA